MLSPHIITLPTTDTLSFSNFFSCIPFKKSLSQLDDIDVQPACLFSLIFLYFFSFDTHSLRCTVEALVRRYPYIHTPRIFAFSADGIEQSLQSLVFVLFFPTSLVSFCLFYSFVSGYSIPTYLAYVYYSRKELRYREIQ